MEKLRQYINRIKAVKHGMDPTAKIEDIREFESRYNIDIPESYVDFLTRVGNGGEFPGLILFPLDRVEAESALWLRRKSEAVFLDKPDISADFPELCGQAEANGEERYDEILSAILNGALVTGTTGCTALAVLMCMGSNRGTIGLVDTDLSDGFEPRLLNINIDEWISEYLSRR